ncbi:MAG: hypothetical protein R2838_25920 [Caldilineaceae bacterium]
MVLPTSLCFALNSLLACGGGRTALLDRHLLGARGLCALQRGDHRRGRAAIAGSL